MTFFARCTIANLLLVGMATASPQAAEYPERNVTVIVPFPPGGASDVTARLITAKLAERVKQTVVVDNRAGANGALGATALKQAPADGYILLVGSIGVFAINPALIKDLKYDPQKDFDLLSVIVRTPNVLVANPGFPANTVRELIDYLNKNPGKITFASSGIGSSDHLTAALFWQKTGTTGIHVPYRGGGPAINDLVGGHANVSFQKSRRHCATGEVRQPQGACGDQRHAHCDASGCPRHGGSGRQGPRGLFLAGGSGSQRAARYD